MQFLSTLLPYAQVGLSIVLVALILLQQSDASLGSAFGGGEASGSLHKKRGIEKTIFNTTILIAVLFVLSAILALFI